MSNSLEIIGAILILCGITYTFLRGMGKLPVADVDEFESKFFKIKGGSGIMLIGLGIILFLSGSNIPSASLPETLTYTSETSTPAPYIPTSTPYIPTPTPSPIPTDMPKVTNYILTVKVSDYATYNSISDASVYFDNSYEGSTDYSGKIDIKGVSQGSHIIEVTKSGYKSVSKQSSVYSNDLVTVYIEKNITSDYLVGDWSYTSSYMNEVVRFTASGTFGLVDTDPIGNIILSSSGTYQLIGSTLTVKYINGVVMPFSFTYIDKDTMELNSNKYMRIK